MAKPNYQFEKRKRDMEKKAKKDEKKARKADKPAEGDASAEGEAPVTDAPASETAV